MKQMKWILVLLMLCALPVLGHADELEIEFSLPSGFYMQPQRVEILCDDPTATVYYTLDGTIPDEDSYVYGSELMLTWSNEREDELTYLALAGNASDYYPTMDFPTGHVLRAVAITEDGECSAVISGTYMIGYDREELYGDTAVMFLVTDPANFFDYETGIYVRGAIYEEYLAEVGPENDDGKGEANYTQKGKDWERPVSVTYLPADDEGFTQDMGVRIKGGASRSRTQKSLRLIARAEYGEKNVKYVLFPDNIREADGGIVDRYKSFTLRNGGNDTNRAKIRDPLIANLATGLCFETAQNMPCIAFLNGEFWGIYTLNEEYTDNYIQYHYDIDDDNIIIYKSGELDEGIESDVELVNDMLSFISTEDMSVAENYAKAEGMLDMQSFADYCALHIYIVNLDGPLKIKESWNWAMWRAREVEDEVHPYADGKWRMMLYDVDNAAGLYSDGSDALIDNITEYFGCVEFEKLGSASMFKSLLANEEFRRMLIQRICDVRSIYFDKARVDAFLWDMVDEYEPYVPNGLRRFGPKWRVSDAEEWFAERIKELRTFFMLRHDVMLSIVQNAFELDEACTVTIQIPDESKGSVYFNNRTIPAQSGGAYDYFAECGLTVTAVPVEGATFAGWTVSQGTAVLADPYALTTDVEFDGPFTLTANFE